MSVELMSLNPNFQTEDDRVLDDLNNSNPNTTGLVEEIEVVSSSSIGHGLLENDEGLQFPAYKEWLAKHEYELEMKRKEEDAKLEKAREEARNTMKKLYTDRISKIEQNKSRNKELQEASVQETSSALNSRGDWSRIVHLIDTKTTPTTTGEKDKSRMREILIKLAYESK
eukprot:TRINITY_DN1406_c0_g1_i2.p1 TRINITY_DN1406_c0_g1~~TRINITY_DN1406_c0_g1_i2.p1  ORF type:complete len:170 (-),score=38.64 TRINITY_DN1406_c0_g1_i2:155-664(-)